MLSIPHTESRVVQWGQVEFRLGRWTRSNHNRRVYFRGEVMRKWFWRLRLKLRRPIGFMEIIDDLQQRLLEAEVDINCLATDKMDESDTWAFENDIADLQDRLNKLEE